MAYDNDDDDDDSKLRARGRKQPKILTKDSYFFNN